MPIPSWLRSMRLRLGYQSSLPKRAVRRRKAGGSRLFLEGLEDRTLPSTFTVMNTNDSGPGSLRQAILDANNIATGTAANPDLIEFQIPDNDPGHIYYTSVAAQTTTGTSASISADSTNRGIDPAWAHSWWRIQPLSTLPEIQDIVIIDGYSQSQDTGTNSNPLSQDDNAVLRIELNGTLDTAFDPSQIPYGYTNDEEGLVIGRGGNGPAATVEGLAVNGFQRDGINLQAYGATVQGDFIGTDISGTMAVPNRDGISIQNATNDLIGGVSRANGNLIAGNLGDGIYLYGGYYSTIEGNRIGTNRLGTSPLANTGDGIRFDNQSSHNTIGGNVAGTGNLISGNSGTGIQLLQGASNNVIVGNLIGTNGAGTAAVGNQGGGIWLNGYSINLSNNRIGTDGNGNGDVYERNVISGNAQDGIEISNGSNTVTNTVVAGNYIGVDVTGSAPLPNQGQGILISGSSNNRIGPNPGDADIAGESNLIAYNGGDGILIEDGASGNTIGGLGNGNVIAFNTGDGVAVDGNATTGNPIHGNSIYSNMGLGIDLTNGGGNSIASPLLSNVSSSGGTTTTITGTLLSAPNTTYVLDFYSSSTLDAPSFEQGQNSLPTASITDQNGNITAGTVTTDANGHVAFTATLPVSFAGLTYLSATATDLNGNTSEFSVGLPTIRSVYYVPSTLDSGVGSLRAAIISANADPYSIINFDLPANDPNQHHYYYRDDNTSNPGVANGTVSLANITTTTASNDSQISNIDPDWAHSWWEIQPLSQLPSITEPTLIDGYSQGNTPSRIDNNPLQKATGNDLPNGDDAVLRIEINGANSSTTADSNPTMLNVLTTNTTVTGLVVNGFDQKQYSIDSSGNTISNFPIAISLGGGRFASQDDVVAGNFIGTDVSGTFSIANSSGVSFIPVSYSRIGMDANNTGLEQRNIISGNNETGVSLVATSDFSIGGVLSPTEGNTVAGNLIGVNKNGQPLPNGIGGSGGIYNGTTFYTPGAGIEVTFGSQDNQIGGPGALSNTIADNAGAGIWIMSDQSFNPTGGKVYSTGNRIENNFIYGNGNKGIFLGGTFNLGTFLDSYYTYASFGLDSYNSNAGPITNGSDSQGNIGPNNLQDFPILNSASSSATSTLISGTFPSGTFSVSSPSEPNTTITVDFYANSSSRTNGEGQTYLGSRTIQADASGQANFTADLAVGGLAGQYISATATDPNGNTSEFSPDIQASGAPSTQTFAQNLAANLPQSTTSLNALTIEVNTTNVSDVVSALSPMNLVNPLVAPVNVYLNLAPGMYTQTNVAVPASITLYINGIPGTVIDPASPAFTVTGGNVVVSNVTFVTTGDAPTILVTGGGLTLRNDIIQESTGGTDAAISVTGGTIDLGTTASLGGNTVVVNGSGEFVHNTTANSISAVGDTFKINNTTQTATSLSFTSLSSSVATASLNQALTFTATVRANGSGTPTGNVDFFDTTTNSLLGTVALSAGKATLTTSTLAVGNHVIVAQYKGSATYLPSLDTSTQAVHYNFSGFLSPLNSNLALSTNRTMPIKFQLTDYNKNSITSLSAVTSLQVLNSQGQNVLTNAGSTALRYDSSANQFVANWQTKGLPAGTYTVTLALADGTTYSKTVQLAANGSKAGLVVDGSTTTTAVGSLLGGNLALYVDNSSGFITSDEQARIDDAVNAVDSVIGAYGVTITETTDSGAANVVLDMGATSAVGGYADGVLGCTTETGEITLIQGWNWYAGAATAGIGGNQFDFETVVTHELGHSLGLGHNTDAGSVMNAMLGTGTVKRALNVADLNVPDTDGGAGGLHAALASIGSVFSSLSAPLPSRPPMVNAANLSMARSVDPHLVVALLESSFPGPFTWAPLETLSIPAVTGQQLALPLIPHEAGSRLSWEQRPLNWVESAFADYNDSGEPADDPAGYVSEPAGDPDLVDSYQSYSGQD
jgi:hypothetical protein